MQPVLQHEDSWTAVWRRSGRLEQPKRTSGLRVGARRAVRMAAAARTHVHLRTCVRTARLPLAVETAAGYALSTDHTRFRIVRGVVAACRADEALDLGGRGRHC